MPVLSPNDFISTRGSQDECCSNNFVDTEVHILDSNQMVVATQPIVSSLPTNHLHFENTVGRYVKVQKNKLSTSLQIAEVQVFAEANCASCGSISECQVPPPCNVDGSCPASVSFVEDGTPCNSKPLGTCFDGQCIQPETLLPTLEPTLSPFTLAPTMYKMTERIELVTSSAVATQSSVCYGGLPVRAIDGNTDGNWYHNSVQHTCNDVNAWWKVDLGASYDYVINRVSIYNRNDCCMNSLAGSDVQILDDSGAVVASEPLVGFMGVYNINFDNVEGRSVRVTKTNGGGLTIAEVKVQGWSPTKSPTRSPTLSPTTAKPTSSPTMSLKPTVAPIMTPAPTGVLINLALVEGVVASQSTTYNGMGPFRAIDGVKTNGSNNVPTTHTECHLPQPWWRAKIGLSKVEFVKVYNRNECCWDRLSDFTVSVLDADMNVIASENYPGTAPRYEAVMIDFSATMPEGEYVEVKLEGTSCLQLTEVEIFGYEIIPPAYNLVSGSAVATQSSTCHGGVPSRAIDGNTDGNYWHNSVQHTCNDANAWWKVDLDTSYEFVIDWVSIYNRNDCCMGSLAGADVQILDSSGAVVASEPLVGVMGVYNINFDNVEGRSVRVKRTNGGLTIAEVKVLGWSYLGDVLSPLPINLARRSGAVPSQSSTCYGGGPWRAVDGNKNGHWNGNSVTHNCNGTNEWWRVDLGTDASIGKVIIYNRRDCCQDRNSDSQVQILDNAMNVVETRSIASGDASAKYELDFGFAVGRYVRVRKNGGGTLNLAEVEVMGLVQQSTTMSEAS